MRYLAGRERGGGSAHESKVSQTNCWRLSRERVVVQRTVPRVRFCKYPARKALPMQCKEPWAETKRDSLSKSVNILGTYAASSPPSILCSALNDSGAGY